MCASHKRWASLALLCLVASSLPVGASSEGWDSWRAGRFDDVRAIAERTLAQDAGDDEARHLLALWSFVSGRYAEGLGHYVRLHPEYARLDELDAQVLYAYQALRRFDLAADFARRRGRSENQVKLLERQHEEPLNVSLAETTVVPFSRDHMIPDWMPAIPITVNGKEYLGHLDTGGSFVHMSPKMAKEIGLETTFVGTGQANLRETRIEQGLVETLQIGDAVLENVPALALDALEGALQRDGDIADLVILGTSILEQFLTTWDNKGQRLVLSPRYDPAARRAHFESYVGDDAEPMEFHMALDHFLLGRGAIGEKEATFFVDTGLVTVDPKGRQPGLMISPESFSAYGGTGDFAEPTFADAPGAVRLGPVSLTGQGVWVNEMQDQHTYLGVKTDALLSYGFLKHCEWTLDFDTRQWFFACEGAAPAPAAVQITDVSVLVGSYEVAPGVDLEVTATDGDLFLQAPGQQRVALVADPDGTFSIPLAGAKIVFERDDTGAVSGLVLHQAGNETRATKK